MFLTRSSALVNWPTLRSRAAILAPYSAMADASASSVLSFPSGRTASARLNQMGGQVCFLVASLRSMAAVRMSWP